MPFAHSVPAIALCKQQINPPVLLRIKHHMQHKADGFEFAAALNVFTKLLCTETAGV
jgi:hypothetical protein